VKVLFPTEYIQYLVHFHGDRDYFECHEILEEYWKDTDPRNKQSHWVGLILLAVSAYHHRRGNYSGAKRTLEKADLIFRHSAESLTELGINANQLLRLVNERLQEISTNRPYSSFNLPISDHLLRNECEVRCVEQGLTWGAESNLSNKGLVHRHKLRDRSDVIAERNNAITTKKSST
jgi:uncharacterized protein